MMSKLNPPKMGTTISPYYLYAIIVIACGSIPKGYDEGGFSSSTGLPSFVKDFGLSPSLWEGSSSGLANREANISSFGVLGAAFGSLLAVALNDRIGRLRSWQLFMAVWMSGDIMQTFSSGILGLMYFARIWGGLGAGALTVLSPLYLSEIAPARTRGAVTSIYMVVLLTFLTIGFFISYAAQKTISGEDPMQYRLVIGISLVPTGLALVGSFFLSDTPRWLASKDRAEEAKQVLYRLRRGQDSERVDEEFEELRLNLPGVGGQALEGATTWTIVKEVATIRTYRVRFLFVLALNTIAQWTGGNGITYYISDIFQYAGVSGSDTSLITSGAYGIVKLVFTMAFTWGLIDILGRRFCFLTGLTLQCASHIWLAIYMSVFYSAESSTLPNKSASDAAIASVFVYAVGWSVGLCTIPYLYGTEVFPTRIRSVCYAVNMAVHWFFQFAVVRVTPVMFDSLNIYGAYIFWACICFSGIIILGLWAPETKGVPMEKMEELFSGPWYATWKASSATLVGGGDADHREYASSSVGVEEGAGKTTTTTTQEGKDIGGQPTVERV